METVKVGFGSDEYFDLLAAWPEWGAYFALGERVILVAEGTAYEVVEGEGEPVAIPPTQVPDPTQPVPENPVPEPILQDPPTVMPVDGREKGDTVPSNTLCVGAIAIAVLMTTLLMLVGLVLWRR
jgi:hypothetical protein